MDKFDELEKIVRGFIEVLNENSMKIDALNERLEEMLNKDK